MAGTGSGQGDIFEVRRIRRLVELMNDHDLNEIDLRQNDQRIRIRRGGDPVVYTASAPVPTVAPAAQPASAAPNAAAGSVPTADEANVTYVTSPMVGTFFSASSPDASSYVKVGDAIGPETTVCIIEAMKVFNEIPAECAGKIAQVLVENGDPVEFGQRLFKVDTSP